MNSFIKKALILGVLLLGWSFGQSTFQSRFANADWYVGGGVSLPIGFTIHAGADDLIAQDFGARLGLTMGFPPYGTAIKIGADALYALPVNDDDFGVHVGAGLRFAHISVSANIGGGYRFSASASGVGIGVLIGATYAFSPQIAAFVEANFDVLANLGGHASLGLGVNYRF